MEIDLTAKDICNIIKACKDAGVNEFTLGSLQFSLGATPERVDQQSPVADPLLTMPQSDQTDQAMQLGMLDEENMREQFFAQQLIDDPQGFETTIADGFIEKERVGDEEARN